MNRKEHPHQHEHVAHAEDVGAGPAGRNGEDVAKKRDVGVRRRNPSSRTDLTARRARPCRARRATPASLRRWRRSRSSSEARRRRAPRRTADRGCAAGTRRPARRCARCKIRCTRAVAVGDDRDEHDLDRERHRGEPDPADPHLPDAAQLAARERDGQEQQEKGEGEGHAGRSSPPSPRSAGLAGRKRHWTDVRRTNVQAGRMANTARADSGRCTRLGRWTRRPAPTFSWRHLCPRSSVVRSLTLQAKTYRSAATLAGLLVLLEALGAPRKL